MIGLDIFGNEVNSIFVDGIELKPIERFEIIIPGYYVSKCGLLNFILNFLNNLSIAKSPPP